MLIIFCEDPLRRGQPDQAFEAEAEAVRTLGIDHGVISYEALVNERQPARAVRRIRGAELPRDAIYRGWMLRPSEYDTLYDALIAKASGCSIHQQPIATATTCRKAILSSRVGLPNRSGCRWRTAFRSTRSRSCCRRSGQVR